MNLNYYISRLNKSIISTFLLPILTTSAIITGIVPQVSLPTGELKFSNIALADNFSDDDLQKYADAAKQIETLRRQAFSSIENIVGKEKAGQLACHQKNTINSLPEEARTIAQNYCSQSEAIVKKSGLSITKFNQITKKIQQDSSLQQKVQSMMR